jgi:hypothetical protein
MKRITNDDSSNPRNGNDGVAGDTFFLPSSNGKPNNPVMESAAYEGLAGRFVNTVLPHTEAAPEALLLSFLAAFGNLIGPGPHARVTATKHPGKLSVVLVGNSGSGRKGTAQDAVNEVMRKVDPDWYDDAVRAGISSGEGLIQAVTKSEDDEKRLLFIEPEFGRVLTVMNRDGNTVSAVLRQAWDGTPLGVQTRKDALEYNGPHHLSVVGHITEAELRRKLNDVDLVNGTVNRLLFALVQRTKLLPEGGDLDDIEVAKLASAIRRKRDQAADIGLMRRDEAAKKLWAIVYPALTVSTDDLAGAITARGDAQTLRLSVLYALLDGSATISEEHLQAALAVWRYCEASVRKIFTGVMPTDRTRLLDAIRAAGPQGLTRTRQFRMFRTLGKIDLLRLNKELADDGLIEMRRLPGKGRPRLISIATEYLDA